MHAVDFVIVAGWIAFWIYWLAASAGAKPGQSRWTRFAGVRIAIVLLVLLLVRLRAFKGHTTTKIAVAILGGYFVYSATMEERYMGDRFPDSYPSYKQHTKMLVPFLF